MLQENSLFLSPLIFFGSPQDVDNEMDDDVCGLYDPWSVSLQTDSKKQEQSHIGLILHWHDINEW